MLTVNIQLKDRKQGNRIVSEEVLEAVQVRHVCPGFKFKDGTTPEEGPGLHVHLPDGSVPFYEAVFSECGDLKLDVFVMNEKGKTVQRFVL